MSTRKQILSGFCKGNVGRYKVGTRTYVCAEQNTKITSFFYDSATYESERFLCDIIDQEITAAVLMVTTS